MLQTTQKDLQIIQDQNSHALCYALNKCTLWQMSKVSLKHIAMFIAISISPQSVIAQSQQYIRSSNCPFEISTWAAQGLCKLKEGYEAVKSSNGKISGCPSGFSMTGSASGSWCYKFSGRVEAVSPSQMHNQIMDLVNTQKSLMNMKPPSTPSTPSKKRTEKDSKKKDIFDKVWMDGSYYLKDASEMYVSFTGLFGRTLMVSKSSHPDIIDAREFDCENKRYRIFAVFHRDSSKWVLHTPDNKNHQKSIKTLPELWTWDEIPDTATFLNDLLKYACK